MSNAWIMRDRRSPSPPPDDRLPTWLWLLKHSQAIVTAGMTAGVLYYHNTHAVYVVCTTLATAFVAKGLKKVIRQPRPEGSKVRTPGMPSTHSATGTYLALYLAFLLASPAGPVRPAWLGTWVTIVLVPTLISFPLLMMYSRVRLGVHTSAQCIVGCALGCVSTVLFVTLWRGRDPQSESMLKAGLRHAPFVPKLDALLHGTLFQTVEVARQN